MARFHMWVLSGKYRKGQMLAHRPQGLQAISEFWDNSCIGSLRVAVARIPLSYGQGREGNSAMCLLVKIVRSIH